MIEFEKFFLCICNYFAYNYKINKLLAINILLYFSKFYTSRKIIKRINIKIF